MKKFGKKGIMGLSLLTSLAIYSGISMAANNNNNTVSTSSDKSSCNFPERPKMPELKKDANGNLIAPDGTIIKLVKPERIESLKTKLGKGATSLTKEDIEDLNQLIGKKHNKKDWKKDGKKPDFSNLSAECKAELEKKFQAKKAEFEKRAKDRKNDLDKKPRITKEEIDSLVKSINSGKVTKEEADKIVKLLNRPHRFGFPGGSHRPMGLKPEDKNSQTK